MRAVFIPFALASVASSLSLLAEEGTEDTLSSESEAQQAREQTEEEHTSASSLTSESEATAMKVQVSTNASYDYDGPYTGRCLGELVRTYPVGGSNQQWSSKMHADAESWCNARSDCHGFMHFDISVSQSVNPNYCCHTGACGDWCGKPQFCMTATAASQVSVNNGWVAYLKPAVSAAATGDPHLQNVHGERFDLMRPGHHILINIPREERADTALLRVAAEAHLLGKGCGEIYFQNVTVTGSWAEAKHAGGYTFVSGSGAHAAPHWLSFGPVGLKVAHGHTITSIQYLSVYVRSLGRAGYPV